MKKFLALAMALCMTLAATSTAFAAEIPDGAGKAGVGFTGENISNLTTEEQQDYLKDSLEGGGYSTQGTVNGDAGSSWVYLSRVDTLRSQAAYGINCTYTMLALAWGLAYSDGNAASGVAVPLSSDWSGETVKTHSSAATISVAFTATATTLDGRVLTSLVPTDIAYIY